MTEVDYEAAMKRQIEALKRAQMLAFRDGDMIHASSLGDRVRMIEDSINANTIAGKRRAREREAGVK